MKRRSIVILVLILIAVLLLVLPLADKTSGSERVIIDNTLHEIVHPSCFDQSELTNYIDEVSYSRATEELGYTVEDACSTQYLQEGKESVISKIFN
ncbi:alpha-amylase [Salinicoccus sp. HZC-1]|uniref:alpha-amylase n=1 Tax=Salinicoccus sp. HZC-1 TaxID=3385497 RepID=UPI00398ADBF3